MVEHIRVYSSEQYDRIAEFRRARSFVDLIRQRSDELNLGSALILTDIERKDSILVDVITARIFLGALVGSFDECCDLGLKDAII